MMVLIYNKIHNYMKIFILAFALTLCNSISAQSELPNNKSIDKNPEWVKLMFAKSADAGLIIEAYDSYYKTTPFVKNKDTQY